MVVAARTGDVTETANELGITNAAVLRRLRKLEQRVAIRLFTDLPGSVTLTRAAKQMLPLAIDAHDRLVALEEFVERNASTELAADARFRSL